MKAIILTARGVQSVRDIAPSSTLPRTTFQWTLPALSASGIDAAVIVGGHEIEALGPLSANVTVYYNAEWATTGMLHSLFVAERELRGPCIICYGDILFGPAALAALLRQRDRNDVLLAVDSTWRNRYPERSAQSLRKAEKVMLSGARATHIAVTLDSTADAEYAGLTLLSGKGAEILRSAYHDMPPAERRSRTLVDLIASVIHKGHDVAVVDIRGHWAELDTAQDIAQYVFKNKAHALETLRPMLGSAEILPQVVFDVKTWRSNPVAVMDAILTGFKQRRVVVRSSALSEDLPSGAAAGLFKSVIGVNKDSRSIESAVAEVIASFSKGPSAADADLVLVQPFLEDVAMSGVLFSRDLRTGAPYYCINSEISGSTDGVTSGRARNMRTVLVHRGTDPSLINDRRVRALVEATKELEDRVGPIPLDVEFAFDRDDRLYIFQARCLALLHAAETSKDTAVEEHLKTAASSIRNRQRPKPPLVGATTLLSNMADWNPAEMIGVVPKPLSISLYEHLITSSVWRRARSSIGYRDPSPERLMTLVAGHPYIDVRCSFNSLLPRALDDGVAPRLIDHYIATLRASPELHDKVEFEIVLSCAAPDMSRRFEPLRRAGFTAEECATLAALLGQLTTHILTEVTPTIPHLLGLTGQLEERRLRTLKTMGRGGEPAAIAALLRDCIEFGTLPFAILARYAFVANAMLRGLQHAGAIPQEQYDGFFRSFSTIARELADADARVRAGALAEAEFLAEFGHLRPGTYDITALRYDEAPELYFPQDTPQHVGTRALPTVSDTDFIGFDSAAFQRISRALTGCGVPVSGTTFMDFARASTQAREIAKFEFTKNVSEILRLTEAFGRDVGLDRARCAFLTLDEIIAPANHRSSSQAMLALRNKVESRLEEHEEWQQVLLPPVIVQPEDVWIVESPAARPNFITHKRVVAPLVPLVPGFAPGGLAGRIVAIENADPGFDWLLTRDIAGLVTKYGGANSHMAIRCAEFGIPAAIGCGDMFEQLLTEGRLLLDCALQIVRGT